MRNRVIGILMVFLAILLFLFVVYKNSLKGKIPVVFSTRSMLEALWNDYKQNYWEDFSGRTLDKQRENNTTSEGQSYTMLRAVWMDDRDIFDKTWNWTRDNLQREDKLFSWLYGRHRDGRYGILTESGGYNSASDADSDIALALIFASSRWQEESYLNEAKQIIPSIWENEVIVAAGKPILAANNVEKNSTALSIVVNPSYFSPYAYRIFSQIDKSGDWSSLVDSSYEIIEQSSFESLDKSQSSGLPPDWVVMNKTTGEMRVSDVPGLTTNFSYDAMRIPWRLALDWTWFGEPRAKELLSKFNFISEEWKSKETIFSTYSHDGRVLVSEEAPAIYGGLMGYFIVAEPDLKDKFYDFKLRSLFDPDSQTWKRSLSYYDSNWAWFGISLYNNSLENLFYNQSVL